jgi:hypothetical protein
MSMDTKRNTQHTLNAPTRITLKVRKLKEMNENKTLETRKRLELLEEFYRAVLHTYDDSLTHSELDLRLHNLIHSTKNKFNKLKKGN